MYTYVCFLDEKSLSRIPSSGHTFHIPAPVIEDRPGGLGLDDIKNLLESTDRDEAFEFTPVSSPGTKIGGRVIGARIIRPRMLFIVPLTFSFTNVKKIIYHSQRLLHNSQEPPNCVEQWTSESFFKMARLP